MPYPAIPIIESQHNAKIKRVIGLRDSSSRRRSGRFLIDGVREISLASKHGIELETIFVDENHQAELMAACGESVRNLLQPVTSKVLERISYGQRQSYPVAVGATPELTLAKLTMPPAPLILVLDRTEKPGNLGACLRSASACGVDAVILTQPVCELFNPNTIRASRGTVFTLAIAITACAAVRSICDQQNIQMYAARVDAQHSLWSQSFTSGSAFVFGSEAHGLGSEWEGIPDFTIPMRGVTDSLNLSISAAITLYEAVRQRGMVS